MSLGKWSSRSPGGRAATPAFRPREAPRAEVVTSMRNAPSRKRSTRRSTSSNRSCATSTIRSSDRTWAERDRSNRSRGSARPSVDTTRPRFIAPILYDGEAAPRTTGPRPHAHLHRNGRALHRDALPQRGRDARGLHRQGAGLPRAQRRRGRGRSSPTTAAPTARQDIARALGARVVDVPAQGLRRALMRRHRGRPRRATSSWATPTTATTSAKLEPFVERLARGRRARHGQPLPGRHRPRARCRRCTATSATRCCSWIGRLLFRAPIGDFHCGLRGFRREASSTSTCRPRAWSSPARWSSRRRSPG